MAGDAIANYKTVASFANEEEIIGDYDKLLSGPVKRSIKQAHVVGFLFGFGAFCAQATFGLLYYTGALFMEYYDEDPVNIYIALLAIMFGATAAGNAVQFGPDIGRAGQAADKIFSIIDMPS